MGGIGLAAFRGEANSQEMHYGRHCEEPGRDLSVTQKVNGDEAI
jgi:hypothetical protein